MMEAIKQKTTNQILWIINEKNMKTGDINLNFNESSQTKKNILSKKQETRVENLIYEQPQNKTDSMKFASC